jgi:NADP-dependent 3-hydroxy acid dehydrogenase YdfG
MQQLAGKVALITGASSGIGEAAALQLAKAGTRVALSGRRRERLEALAERIAADGGEALALAGDIAVEAEATKAVEETVAAFGRLDILINSAGVNDVGTVDGLPMELWRKVIDINLMGTLYTCRAAAPLMRAQGSGHIVNVSSLAGQRAAPNYGAYVTSKFGLTGLTGSLRQELGEHGIRVSLVEPGATQTEIAESITDRDAREAIRKWVSKDGAMAASDIADGIVFLLALPPRANVSLLQIRPTIDVRP